MVNMLSAHSILVWVIPLGKPSIPTREFGSLAVCEDQTEVSKDVGRLDVLHMQAGSIARLFEHLQLA